MSDENCKCKTCKCESTSVSEATGILSVKLLTLLDSPEIDCKLSESESVIYVNDLDVIKNSCGTGRLEILGREILINVCESANVVHVNLDLEVNNKKLPNTPFIVKLTEGKSRIELNNKFLMIL